MTATLTLKTLASGEIPEALERAAHYRALGESAQAGSICHDILLVDPTNQRAWILLTETLCDRFGQGHGVDIMQALEILPQIEDLYDRAFHAGLICDHKAVALLNDSEPGCRCDAYEYLREAMTCYEKAEQFRPDGCSEARQRWNACARIIASNNLQPWPDGDQPRGPFE